nr:CapA family protein [Bradyrhizobium canariense]
MKIESEPPPTGSSRSAAEFDSFGSIETNVIDGFTLAAVGDVMMRRPHTVVQSCTFSPVIKFLQDADVAFGNLETSITDLRKSKGHPIVNGDAYHVSTLAVAPDLKAIGFNLMARANNHTCDWGVEGMRETTEVLDLVGVAHAGVGENLAQAGAPSFLETRRGRVGLISLTTTFPPACRAADAAGQAPGRPGLNALRLTRSVVVPPDMLQILRQISKSLPDAGQVNENPDHVLLAGTTYRAGDRPGYSFEPNAHDVKRILKNVREGKQSSDFLVVANHDHYPGNWSEVPANYAQAFSHQAIDFGADAIIGHGPHILRGIEIYKGRPIFYSLGNFLFDNLNPVEGADYFEHHGCDPSKYTVPDVIASAMDDFRDTVFFESVVAVSRFVENQIKEIRLFPIELNFTKRLADRGVPCIPSLPHSEAILERLQKLSESYGTHIAIEKGVGIIRL